jgi:hypothetical protein
MFVCFVYFVVNQSSLSGYPLTPLGWGVGVQDSVKGVLPKQKLVGRAYPRAACWCGKARLVSSLAPPNFAQNTFGQLALKMRPMINSVFQLSPV